MKLALPNGALTHTPLIPLNTSYGGAAAKTQAEARATARMEILTPQQSHPATKLPGAYTHKHAPFYDRACRHVTPQLGGIGQLIDIYI
jgi:hypothetical protein